MLKSKPKEPRADVIRVGKDSAIDLRELPMGMGVLSVAIRGRAGDTSALPLDNNGAVELRKFISRALRKAEKDKKIMATILKGGLAEGYYDEAV